MSQKTLSSKLKSYTLPAVSALAIAGLASNTTSFFITLRDLNEMGSNYSDPVSALKLSNKVNYPRQGGLYKYIVRPIFFTPGEELAYRAYQR